MKFQNSSIHGSEVMLCIKKRDERTDGRTDNPEAICPPNFFEVGGIMKGKIELSLGVWEGLLFVIVAFPGLFSYLFFFFKIQPWQPSFIHDGHLLFPIRIRMI